MASEQELQQFYIGQDITTVPKPAAILDAAIIRRHCRDMLQTIEQLNVGFRAHIKSHKTTQIAHLQVSTNPTLAANFIVSTILELETLLPLLQQFKTQNRRFNVLYGIPLVPSHVRCLAEIALHLNVPGSISVMIDHATQIDHLHQFWSTTITNFPVCVFLKVDTGYHRAGLPPTALNKSHLIERIVEAERLGVVKLLGVYSHSSLSYASTTPEEAMMHLVSEIEGCKEAVRLHANLFSLDNGKEREMVVSVGATPQILSSRHLLLQDGNESPEAAALRNALTVQETSSLRVSIEFHAGVYPLLDMQQFSTNASASVSTYTSLLNRTPDTEIAISILAEVCSIYNDGERDSPEALLAAGTLALGREPCASYPGWGLISSWKRQDERLIVARISQEHAIVSYEYGGGGSKKIPLSVGQMVKIFPNHACVAGAFYNHYFVVDSELDPDAAKIVDVWVRAKGSDKIKTRILHSRNQ